MPKGVEFRSPDPIAKSLAQVVKATARVWRKHHLSYDDTRAVARAVRAQLEVKRPKARRTVVDRLTKEEADRFIEAAYGASGARGLMLKALLQTGCRVSEFAALRVDDLQFAEATIVIRQGKGDKARTVPILPQLAQELRTHLGGREVGALFETRLSRAYGVRRLQQIVQEVAGSAGIRKHVFPHLLRHTIAQQLLEGGMPLDQVQRFLGHERIETTLVYAGSTTAMIRDSYRAAMGAAR
jgi:integrase/recombinase XerD